MLQITAADSGDNPWRDPFVRERNALLIRWLYHLGLRRGELLSVLVSDINFQAGKVAIVRRPNNRMDKRRLQPLVKTRGREIPLSRDLLQQTHRFILDFRYRIPTARKHEYLFVSRSGEPMSISACNKIFNQIRISEPTLLKRLTPHVLRHSWNDRFSEEIDKGNISENDERKMRCHLMGWSPTSEMAAVYTRRHIREKAERASLELQGSLINCDIGSDEEAK